MATKEGPLSKWTNVMKGWQYRWFVLDENSGLLSYYTSKEKMMRGARRGCVRLKGAVIGIDDEDDSTFTITVDLKTFHFQARDVEEKEKWIDALETTIERHSQPQQVWDQRPKLTLNDFDKKLAETDAYLQILIDQAQALETRIDECADDTAREKYNVIKVTAEAMIESIKQSIVVLQISKQMAVADTPLINGPSFDSLSGVVEMEPHSEVDGAVDIARELDIAPNLSRSTDNLAPNTTPEMMVNGTSLPCSTSMPNLAPPSTTTTTTTATTAKTVAESGNNVAQVISSSPIPIPHESATMTIPDTSYSSSEDEDFYDAEQSLGKSGPYEASPDEEPRVPPKVIASADDEFDELYDDNEDDELDSLDKHGSIITHLLSQVRIGMDLTKIVLPTFILERRSLLEMYADFLAHPDLWVKIADMDTPEDRMVETVRWYMSAFHAGRRSSIAKKPYNPIIGETFRCYYDLPEEEKTEERDEDGPMPWATKNNVVFLAEQVSHHPPISAFYADHYNKRISLDGYIWTKSKFLGLSIGVHMIGQAVLSVLDYGEHYTLTFPNGYGRSILTVPWVELGGRTTINCAETGYNATIDFHTKPFYGGKKDRVTAEIFAPNERKSFCTVQGEWNGVMYAKYTSGKNEVFVDTKTMPIIKKRVKPIDQQEEYESRRLWQHVTKHLKNKDVTNATTEKHRLEQRQREEAKERKEKGEKWETRHFHEVGEHWVYDKTLQKRIGDD